MARDAGQRGLSFLRFLFAKAPDSHYVEFLAISAEALRRWHLLVREIGEFSETQARSSERIYFGVLPRREPWGGAREVLYSTCAWVDIEGTEAPGPLPLPPSAIVKAPSGYQCYWVFDTPLIDPDRLEGINRRLAHVVGGNPGAAARGYLLPVPDPWSFDDPAMLAPRLIHLDTSMTISPTTLEAAVEDRASTERR